jgi:hypothetical protein
MAAVAAAAVLLQGQVMAKDNLAAQAAVETEQMEQADQ